MSSVRRVIAGSLIVAAAWALALAVAPSRAGACSCIAMEPSHYVSQASLAFLGRAVAVERSATETRTRLEVLYALRGSPGPEHVIRRPGTMVTSCDRTFERGEVALVFVAADGDVEICSGNYAIETQLPRLMEYLVLGPEPRATAPPEAIAAAVAAISVDGARTVLHRPSAGRSVTVGTTTVRFVARRAALRVNSGRFGSLVFTLVSNASNRRRWLTLLRLQSDGTWASIATSEETRCPDGRWQPTRGGC